MIPPFTRKVIPFSLKTLQKDSNCIAIQDPSAVWGVQDFLPRRNLLTYSEEAADSSWTKGALDTSGSWSNVDVGPEGTQIGSKLIENSSSAWHELSRSYTFVSGVTYRLYARLKKGTRTTAGLWLPGAQFVGTPKAQFNLDSGTVVSSTDVLSATITPLANGYYGCEISQRCDASGSGVVEITLQFASYAGDGASYIYFAGAQLIRADTLDQSYQKITDWTTEQYAWAAAKQVPWLRANVATYTDDLTNAAWTKSSTTAPSAGVLQCSAATAAHEFRSTTGPITPVVGQTYYLSCKAKQGTHAYVQLACFSGMHASAYANFDLSTGAAGTSASCTPTISVADADGYYTISIAVVANATPAASGFRLSIQQSASDTRQQSWTAAGTETVNVKNIGLYVGSLPAYQPILADWDETYTAAAIAAGYPISLWTDSAGTKAVNADNQAIGACRDLKYGDYGPELVVNGTLATGDLTGWVDASTAPAYISASSGRLVLTRTGAGGTARARQAVSTSIGKRYFVQFTASNFNAAGSCFSVGTTAGGTDVLASQTIENRAFCFVITALGSETWINFFTPSIECNLNFDNISVREIPGYTAIQATTANQPKWRLDANGKALFERDGVNDAMPITLPNLGSNCSVYIGEGSTVTELTGQTLNGSYEPITPAKDYGRVIFQTPPSKSAKVIKWLLAKAGY